VLVCFYGVSWYADKSWVDSGLYNIYEEAVNLGVLFDFLSIGSLVLIPIITISKHMRYNTSYQIVFCSLKHNKDTLVSV
jgi:hypothetical protein